MYGSLENKAEITSLEECSWTPLHFAANGGYKEIVKLLLEHKAIIDSLDLDMATPLHYAAEEGHAETVKLLLEHNAAKESLDKEQVFISEITIFFTKII